LRQRLRDKSHWRGVDLVKLVQVTPFPQGRHVACVERTILGKRIIETRSQYLRRDATLGANVSSGVQLYPRVTKTGAHLHISNGRFSHQPVAQRPAKLLLPLEIVLIAIEP